MQVHLNAHLNVEYLNVHSNEIVNAFECIPETFAFECGPQTFDLSNAQMPLEKVLCSEQYPQQIMKSISDL